MNTTLRTLLAAGLLVTGSNCSPTRIEYEDGSWAEGAASGCRVAAPCDLESSYRVQLLTTDSAVLVRMGEAGALSIHPDSLSVTIRPGETVARCNRPTATGRVVTWCRSGQQ
jgi:hypothetical protein